MSAFAIPLSGLEASSSALNTIANNLSNLNTDGYKDQTLSFADIFNQAQGNSGNGDPIATAQSPTCAPSELPIVTGDSGRFGSILITATSVSISIPITRARYSVLSPCIFTKM